MKPSKEAALLGALVGDAAALGLHWIYDTERTCEVAERHGSAAFVPIVQVNYDGVTSYYVHEKRGDGAMSMYGETLRGAIQSMIKTKGVFDVATYQQDYFALFGPDGTYDGYMDHATKGTIKNIEAGKLDPSGVDDDEHPAITRLPAIVVANQNAKTLPEEVEASIQVTNVQKDSSEYGLVFALVLKDVLDGNDLIETLEKQAEQAPERIKQSLLDALETDETDSVAYSDVTGSACHLPMSVPLSFHILKHTNSYEDAIEENIKAGGDNCGRSIMLGAILGAMYGRDGIPEEWVQKTNDAEEMWGECTKLVKIVG